MPFLHAQPWLGLEASRCSELQELPGLMQTFTVVSELAIFAPMKVQRYLYYHFQVFFLPVLHVLERGREEVETLN